MAESRSDFRFVDMQKIKIISAGRVWRRPETSLMVLFLPPGAVPKQRDCSDTPDGMFYKSNLIFFKIDSYLKDVF